MGLEVVNGPALIAELSNCFTLAWVAYVFPLVCAFAKIHVTAAPSDKAKAQMLTLEILDAIEDR